MASDSGDVARLEPVWMMATNNGDGGLLDVSLRRVDEGDNDGNGWCCGT